jgi:hypothetical protein
MAAIKQTLAFAGMSLLERCSLIAEWVHHAETKISVSGQLIRKPKGAVLRAGLRKRHVNCACPAKPRSHLEAIGTKYRVAIVCVTHFTKAKGGSALARVTGSFAFVAC